MPFALKLKFETPVIVLLKNKYLFNTLLISKKYKYAIYDENSLGIGYVTEKLPEIIAAGSVPLTIGTPPGSLFEPVNVMHGGEMHKLYKLSQKPSLTEIESSLRMYLR